jgi:hypothetical protein
VRTGDGASKPQAASGRKQTKAAREVRLALDPDLACFDPPSPRLRRTRAAHRPAEALA